ncbi:Smr/MutS family protein [Chitinivorax sp. B]|uniref:Smr/MutS family protein n=1 Tax=Chitinivorax sp. B TaxID=2502235 RepID=UPI0010F765D3|nr:Smr/MutS family protein [Chitinivorax sp. B]
MDDDALSRLKALRKRLVQQSIPTVKPAPIPADELDKQVFNAAMKDVMPLRHQPRVALNPPKPWPVARQHELDEQQALVDSMSDWSEWEFGPETGNEPAYVRQGMRRDTLKKLRRGHWVVEAQIDLHGLTVDEARFEIAQFLYLCKRDNKRCVRIIHGKGLGSKNRESVLRAKVPGWLTQRDEVLAFCQARKVDGDSGALIVLLRGSN